MIVDSLTIGAPVSQSTVVDEGTWQAILVYEGPEPPPPPPNGEEVKWPWWLVGVGAAAAVGIVLAKEKTKV